MITALGSGSAGPDLEPGDLARGQGADVTTVMINLGRQPVDLPAHDEILLTSAGLTVDYLPPDTAVWLRAR